MHPNFDLIITADYPSRTAELRLLDGAGSQLAYRSTDFKTVAVGRQKGLFDLRDYVRHYVVAGQEAASVADVGVCIAEDVLGEEIFRTLWESEAQRTLRVQLPGATEEANHLAGALARVPWELARPGTDEATLAERNLLVRVVHEMDEPATQPLDLDGDEALRVLFVFAEAPGSRPLAARLERQRLRRLFGKEVYPTRRVVADFLSHGVTRERLEERIGDRGGYHVIHWSGHGHLNLLELAKAGGGSDRISGDDLLDLCGGFIPRLVFLSACHSGDILRVPDWNQFLAIAEGGEPDVGDGRSADDTKDIELDEPPGYTGTAHALLQRGVPSVVAMRYAVGDDYARDLGVEFYRALLAHSKPKTAATSLTMARQALIDAERKDSRARYSVCDHATPVLYGAEQPGLTLPSGRSPDLRAQKRRLHGIMELTATSHEHFVGRTWQLAGLGSDFIGSSRGGETKPVAIITGLGGMGKTALTAEALSLWEARFDWVLLYQAKPNALGFEGTMRDIHMKLSAELGRYHEHVQANRADAIFRKADADAGFIGEPRLERMTDNLIRAMQDERVLLVLDNFESNLKPKPETSAEAGEPRWACQDPAWDRCLSRLATELVGMPSRVLVTCRRPLAALDEVTSHGVLLGPLPSGEAALYLRTHQGLRAMVFGGEDDERALATRLLTASRFHPLLMNRLARLATGGPELRPQLMHALEALETSRDFDQLPELFAVEEGDERELAYLDDALASSIDRLIEDVGPDARRLLWIISLANEPEALGLLRGVWSGESLEQQQIRHVKRMLDKLSSLPPKLQEELNALPPDLRARIDTAPLEAPARPDPGQLLSELAAVGLVTEERDHAGDDNPNLTCHELVRERITCWMSDHPDDHGGLTEKAVRLAYAERLETVFSGLVETNMTNALGAGSRALVYYVQAEEWDQLGGFASALVASARDPSLFAGLIPHLEAAVDAAPEGRTRWICISNLADALAGAGRPDATMTFYEQAVTQARLVAEAGGRDARQAWSDLAVATENWAHALRQVGDLDSARQRHVDSAEAERHAGNPAVGVIGSELSALRIDVIAGRVEEALPEIETRLEQVQIWWERHRAGQPVPEAPNGGYLARVFISALDIANDADRARGDWGSALRRTEAILGVKRALGRPAHDIAGTLMNRAVELNRLGRFGEAQAELEACLPVFENDPVRRANVLGALARLFGDQGDFHQAIIQERRALSIREQLPNPAGRAASHNNLANYLERRGTTADVDLAQGHKLAALLYKLVAGLGQSLQASLSNYTFHFRQAQVEGSTLTVPRVDQLLVDPTFAPLGDWLRQRQVDPSGVQSAVDQFLQLAQEAAAKEQ